MFTPITQQHLSAFFSTREGETRIGQTIHTLDEHLPLNDALAQAKFVGARFALVGINEDIGPRANLGRGGANKAFSAMLSQWLNLQSNRYLSGNECVVVGEINIKHLDADDPESLRHATANLDNEVVELLSKVFAAGLEPIVIGGGHNNAYPILTAAKNAFNQPLAAINLDPHSDFRPREGRHSGNGFSYAAANGALKHYHILGLHELKNSEATLAQLSLFGASWHTYQQIWTRRETPLADALEAATRNLSQTQLPVGVELDVDAITSMPSSASTSAGVPLTDACHYLYYLAKHCNSAYCHIAEAAPQCHSANEQAGYREVGQSLSELIYAYIQGRIQA